MTSLMLATVGLPVYTSMSFPTHSEVFLPRGNWVYSQSAHENYTCDSGNFWLQVTDHQVLNDEENKPRLRNLSVEWLNLSEAWQRTTSGHLICKAPGSKTAVETLRIMSSQCTSTNLPSNEQLLLEYLQLTYTYILLTQVDFYSPSKWPFSNVCSVTNGMKNAGQLKLK